MFRQSVFFIILFPVVRFVIASQAVYVYLQHPIRQVVLDNGINEVKFEVTPLLSMAKM